ncbi:MAG: flagellar biosynthesis protein FliQ [Phycisphaerae bacterium]|nr:flagellar biosynthesis protein FliQ [Phycisphaerae bacterium]
MDHATAMEIGRQTLLLAFKLALPLLCVGLVIGVMISILQAVTQVQEMTLTFVPKLIAMAVAALILMPWMFQQITDFAVVMFGPMVVP